MLPERLQTTLNKENVPFNVNSLCNLGPMQCCSARGSKQHFTGKIQAIQGMSFAQHLVMLFTYIYIKSSTSKKYVKLSAARYSTQQLVKLLVRHYLKK